MSSSKNNRKETVFSANKPTHEPRRPTEENFKKFEDENKGLLEDLVKHDGPVDLRERAERVAEDMSRYVDLDELLKLCESATPGPWVWDKYGDMGRAYKYKSDGNTKRMPTDEEISERDYYVGDYIIRTDSGVYPPHGPDKDFVTKANPDTVKRLVLAVKRMRGALNYTEEVYNSAVVEDCLKEVAELLGD